MSHVSDGTGGYKRRTLDAIAMSLWPSAGLDMIGFEIKRSRQDLKREIEHPEKADAFKDLDLFVLVVPEKLTEGLPVPEAWGIMVLRGTTGLRMKAADRMQKAAREAREQIDGKQDQDQLDGQHVEPAGG